MVVRAMRRNRSQDKDDAEAQNSNLTANSRDGLLTQKCNSRSKFLGYQWKFSNAVAEKKAEYAARSRSPLGGRDSGGFGRLSGTLDPSQSTKDQEVVHMTEIVPGSLRKLELLTGSKVIPPPKPPPAATSRREKRFSGDTRYSKRRYSHPMRISIITSSSKSRDEYQTLSEVSPTTTSASVDTSKMFTSQLRPPPVPKQQIFSWTGGISGPAGENGTIEEETGRPSIDLEGHIVSQHKEYRSSVYENVLKTSPSPSSSDLRRTVSRLSDATEDNQQSIVEEEDRPALPSHPRFNYLAPQPSTHVQQHRRSWSGRSVLELESTPGENSPKDKGKAVLGLESPNPTDLTLNTSMAPRLSISTHHSPGRLTSLTSPSSLSFTPATPTCTHGHLGSSRGNRDSTSTIESTSSSGSEHMNATILTPTPAQRRPSFSPAFPPSNSSSSTPDSTENTRLPIETFDTDTRATSSRTHRDDRESDSADGDNLSEVASPRNASRWHSSRLSYPSSLDDPSLDERRQHQQQWRLSRDSEEDRPWSARGSGRTSARESVRSADTGAGIGETRWRSDTLESVSEEGREGRIRLGSAMGMY